MWFLNLWQTQGQICLFLYRTFSNAINYDKVTDILKYIFLIYESNLNMVYTKDAARHNVAYY